MITQEIKQHNFSIQYGKAIEEEISKLQSEINKNERLTSRFESRWLAIKLIESDPNISEKIMAIEGGGEVIELSKNSVEKLEKRFSDDLGSIFADKRYGWINGLVKEIVDKSQADRISMSDKIDKIVTNRILGIPIFLAMMWAVFKFTTDVAGPFLDWVDGVIGGPITNWVESLINLVGLGGTWVESLFIDGIIAGVGGVMVFAPVMLALYFALAILEDSGYMARAAFVMDRLMHSFGLHGKSFICMIIGFGCTVPAILATRTLEKEKDRLLTGLLVPFMSCGARLPVYVLFASIFFPQNSNTVIFILYLTGIVVAMVLGIVLNGTLFKNRERSPFVLELPPYRMPTLRNIWFLMWERTSAFVHKAFSFIMVTSIIIWLLIAIPVNGGPFAESKVEDSSYAYISQVIAPVLQPTGFASWQNTGALVSGFVAKEVVVGTMGQIFNVEEEEGKVIATSFFKDLGEVVTSFFSTVMDTIKSIPLIVGIDLFESEEEDTGTKLMAVVKDHFEEVSGGHGALASLSFMVFVLLYTPCMVAVAAQLQEFGVKWAIFGALLELVVAYIASVIVFQGGLLLGLG
ncbi:MAG: ferrous iron transport protein B [Anaerolineaceae bacterium]|nr:ferrous iron transport protein B [Anaerolineaceae bacterium]